MLHWIFAVPSLFLCWGCSGYIWAVGEVIGTVNPRSWVYQESCALHAAWWSWENTGEWHSHQRVKKQKYVSLSINCDVSSVVIEYSVSQKTTRGTIFQFFFHLYNIYPFLELFLIHIAENLHTYLIIFFENNSF